MRGVLPRGPALAASRPPSPPAAGGPGGRTRHPRAWPRGPATRPVAAPPSAGPRLQDRAPRAHPRDRHPRVCARGNAARSSATRPSAAAGTGSHRTGRTVAPSGDQDTGTGPGIATPSVTCTDRSSVTCTGSRCRRGPSGVNGFPRCGWRASRAAPACGSSPLPPPQARQWPEPAGRVSKPPKRLPRRSSHADPYRGRLAGPDWVPRQALSAPRPATACAGPWPLPSRSRARARLAGQHLGETGRRPDSCPHRQPGTTDCRVSRMFPIACYGLTPRCREVKR